MKCPNCNNILKINKYFIFSSGAHLKNIECDVCGSTWKNPFESYAFHCAVFLPACTYLFSSIRNYFFGEGSSWYISFDIFLGSILWAIIVFYLQLERAD